VALTVASAAFVLVVVRLGVKSRRRRVVSGREELVGSTGESMHDGAGEGWARVHGELWRVRSAVPLRTGDAVRVRRVDGLTLEVEPASVDSEGSRK
jgi:membrane-bound serine protease (ClpP class)